MLAGHSDVPGERWHAGGSEGEQRLQPSPSTVSKALYGAAPAPMSFCKLLQHIDLTARHRCARQERLDTFGVWGAAVTSSVGRRVSPCCGRRAAGARRQMLGLPVAGVPSRVPRGRAAAKGKGR